MQLRHSDRGRPEVDAASTLTCVMFRECTGTVDLPRGREEKLNAPTIAQGIAAGGLVDVLDDAAGREHLRELVDGLAELFLCRLDRVVEIELKIALGQFDLHLGPAPKVRAVNEALQQCPNPN